MVYLWQILHKNNIIYDYAYILDNDGDKMKAVTVVNNLKTKQ